MDKILLISKEIHYYDSQNGRGLKYLRGLLRWLRDEHQSKKLTTFDPKEWKLQSKTDIMPQQENGYDCGIFLLMAADYLMAQLPFTFNQSQANRVRQKVGTDIVRGQLSYATSLNYPTKTTNSTTNSN